MTTQKSSLRFAALRRVSTEKQEKEGESLRTQKKEIENAIQELGGKIIGWYGGKEHAMPGYEKEEIERLLNDATKKKFDAVIVTNADRWSRDNKTSQSGLNVFKKHGIRFFEGMTEHDLHRPEHVMYLGVSAVVGQFFGSNQKRKSMINRIARAKRGIPTVGNLPVARTFDRKTETWGIDSKKYEIIKEIATRYLAGESLEDLSNEFKINRSALHKNLLWRCGDTWEVSFESDEFNIHEKVKIKIPRLLPESTIKAIRNKAQANKTYTHGQIKNPYILSRVIFCGHCGYAMFGHTNIKPTFINRYYKHNRRLNCPNQKTWIRCEDLENTVMWHLFDMFGNPKKVQEAMERAFPNLEKVKEHHARIERLQKQIEQIDKGRDKVVKWAISGKLTDNEAEKQLDNLNMEKQKTNDEINRLSDYLNNLPNPNNIKAASKRISCGFNAKRISMSNRINRDFDSMTFEEKRSLVESVFSGHTADGKRMGVYVYWDEDGNWSFDIKGHLIDEIGLKPINEEMKEAYFGNFENAGIYQKTLKTKSACPLPDIISP